jgi:hypothetical protein
MAMQHDHKPNEKCLSCEAERLYQARQIEHDAFMHLIVSGHVALTDLYDLRRLDDFTVGREPLFMCDFLIGISFALEHFVKYEPVLRGTDQAKAVIADMMTLISEKLFEDIQVNEAPNATKH